MGKLRDRRVRRDATYRRAKAAGYAARSVYKLEEIDRRYSIFKSATSVLDLGCRPGSWLQFAAERLGEKGRVVGVDRQALDISPVGRVEVLVGDVFSEDLLPRLAPYQPFDLILSDMAPDTTGIAVTDQSRSALLCQRTLDIADHTARRHGHVLLKLLMGEHLHNLRTRIAETYRQVHVVRPQATRSSSSEVYLLGLQRRQGQ